MSTRWLEASYIPGFLVLPELVSSINYIYPQPCSSRVPRGETPVMGDPETVEKVYGEWKTLRHLNVMRRFRVLNLTTGEESPMTFQSIHQAQEWAEEQR